MTLIPAEYSLARIFRHSCRPSRPGIWISASPPPAGTRGRGARPRRHTWPPRPRDHPARAESATSRRRSGVFVHRAQEVDVDALLLAENAERPQLPPLVGGEVGGDLGLAAGFGKPLDQVKVGRLQQTDGDVHPAGSLGQLRLVVYV